MPPLSILELARVTEDTDAKGALDNARDLARHAEDLGYRRIWVAEHHNMRGIASAATSIVIAHIAAGTSTIRVGAGGIMLPNHAPLVVAEQVGTLATLYEDVASGRPEALAAVYETASLPLFENWLAMPGGRLNCIVPQQNQWRLPYSAEESRPFVNLNRPEDVKRVLDILGASL